jgi:hypothetical protein
MELWWEFKKFSENYGTFFWVPVSIFMRVKTLRKEMVQYESKCIKSSK